MVIYLLHNLLKQVKIMKQQQLDMFESTDGKRAEQVSLFRYVRPMTLTLDKNDDLILAPDAKGGIVFYFHINQILEKLTFTWSICHKEDNFNRHRGMQIAKGRFDKFYSSEYITDQILTIDYDRELSLVDNVLYHLLITRSDMEQEGFHVREFWSKQLYSLYDTLTEIVGKNDTLLELVDFEHA